MMRAMISDTLPYALQLEILNERKEKPLLGSSTAGQMQ